MQFIDSSLYFCHKTQIEVNAILILIIAGIVLYVVILLVILVFCRISARADRDMRIICNGELSYSNSEGQNLLELTTEDKDSEDRIHPLRLSKGLPRVLISDRWH